MKICFVLKVVIPLLRVRGLVRVRLKGVFVVFAQFWQNVPCRASGQCLGSVIPLTYYSFFQEDLVIVSGQYLGSFAQFWAVFGQFLDKKNDRLATPSVIVNC